MNAFFNSSFGAVNRRTVALAIFMALAALGFLMIPAHKALAADTVNTAVYQDLNNDGYIDNIRWTMDENVTACPFVSGNWSIPQAGTVSINSVTGLTCSGTTTLDIAVTSNAATPTTGGATNPTLTYTHAGGANITLTSGSMGTHTAQAATDDAAPIVVSVEKTRNGTLGNYDENILVITYSEKMTIPVSFGATTATFGDLTTAGLLAGLGSFAAGDMTVPTTKNGIIGGASPTVIVLLAAHSEYVGGGTPGYYNPGTTSELSGLFTPVAVAGVHDAVNKQVNIAHTVTPTSTVAWDVGKPTISSITLADAAGNNGKIDRATVVFSKQIRDESFTNANGTLGGQTGTFYTGSGAPSVDDNTMAFNLTADTLPIDTSINAAKLNYSAATTPITDRAGNLLATTTPGTIVDADNVGKLVDGAAPILVSAVTSNSGTRNLITFTYSEPMAVTNGASSTDIGAMTMAGTVAGIGSFITPGGVTVPTASKNTIAGNGTNTITVTLADQVGGYIANGSVTDPTGVFTPFTNAFITDNSAALNHVNTANHPTSSSGGAWTLTQPTLTSVTISDDKSGLHNGRVDTATVLFSAAVRAGNITDADGTLGGGAGTFATGTTTSVFTVTSDTLPIDTTAAPQFLYTGATTKITDLFGNLLNTPTVKGTIAAGDAVQIDGANPVIVATSPASGATSVGLIDPVIVTFSEPMAGPGTGCTFSAAGASAGYGDITLAANWGAANGLANSQVTLTKSTSNAYNRAITVTIAGCTAASAPAALVANASAPNPWTFTTRAGSSVSSGGGNVVVTPPSVTLSIPNGGETYSSGVQIGISWSSANGAFVNYRVSYSSNNGNAWSVLNTTSNSSYTWTVPTASTTQGLIKVEGLNSTGTVLASATSASNFIVKGTTVAPPSVAPPAVTPPATPPATDPTVAGTYDSSTAKGNNPDFNTDMGLSAKNQEPISNPPCVSGTLIKGSLPAVYYCGANGKRYVFVNDKAYFSWYPDFSTVQTVSDATLANIMIGGNITYRPGSRMVKIQSDPKTYVVARGGVLRWVETEAAAVRLFGANWNTMIDDVADSFFVNYKVGTPIAG